MFESLKEFCFHLSYYNGIGDWRTGSFVASLFSIPLIYLLRAFHSFSSIFFYTVSFILFLLILIVIQMALHHITDKDSSVIVLDKTLGMAIAFFGISFNFKFVLVGFCLFHLLLLTLPILTCWSCKIDLDSLPGVVGIVASDLIVGLVINLFFRFSLWLAC
jgi:phosphatidylglycerophosphatase A